jgi:D-serine deaminase-like pyridoxal phosphate-dependent protein
MSGRVARSSEGSERREASSPRLLVLDGETAHEVFDVLSGGGAEDVSRDGAIMRARSALLFEVGEQLHVRIEHSGSVWQATARVLGHAGPDGDRITELEISGRRAVVG